MDMIILLSIKMFPENIYALYVCMWLVILNKLPAARISSVIVAYLCSINDCLEEFDYILVHSFTVSVPAVQCRRCTVC